MEIVGSGKSLIEEARAVLVGISEGEREAHGNAVHIGIHCVAVAHAPNTSEVTEEVHANARLYARAPALITSLIDELEQQVALNQTQAQSIVEFQREQTALREMVKTCSCGLSDLLSTSLTPQGEQK